MFEWLGKHWHRIKTGHDPEWVVSHYDPYAVWDCLICLSKNPNARAWVFG